MYLRNKELRAKVPFPSFSTIIFYFHKDTRREIVDTVR